jgi:sarcosine oxidase, subunit gamma
MSRTVTALNGAQSTDGIAEITEAGLQGMISLRGDLDDRAIRKAVKAVATVDMPGQGQVNCVENRGVCWMSPDELLVLCPYETVSADLAKIQTGVQKTRALAVDVSDARASFYISGAHAREVMAKLAPVDFSPAVFTLGMFRRSRMAQVPAAFWLRDADTFQIICFRSHAQYMFDLLKVAAQKGSAVGVF